MSSVGHKLLAVNVDGQLIDILSAQVLAVAQTSLGHSVVSKEDCDAIVQAAYYTLSFTSRVPSTPGMRSMGLTMEPASASIFALLVCCYSGLKWSVRKFSALSALEGWSQEPERSVERRLSTAANALVLAGKVLSLASFLVFLSTGDCPSLLYRLTGLNMVAGSGTGGGEGGRRAGPSAAQLYVEGKKALWLALLGASAAASVTVDWQSLRYWGFRLTTVVAAALHRIRGAPTGNRSSDNSSSSGGGSPQPSAGTGPGLATSSEEAVRIVCAHCSLSPPESPHALDCGHSYCYLCAHALLHAPSTTSSNTYLSGGADGAAQCLQCYRPVRSMVPLGSQGAAGSSTS